MVSKGFIKHKRTIKRKTRNKVRFTCHDCGKNSNCHPNTTICPKCGRKSHFYRWNE